MPAFFRPASDCFSICRKGNKSAAFRPFVTNRDYSGFPVSSGALMTKHVTIVEDDPDVRAVLARSLGANGYEVTALESGVGIEDVISSGQVDLVIIDIGLPDVDGLTITQQIRRYSDVGIIIVSGRGDLADRVVGLEIGADDYVTKPFEPREMLARVRSVLRRGRRQDAAAPRADGH